MSWTSAHRFLQALLLHLPHMYENVTGCSLSCHHYTYTISTDRGVFITFTTKDKCAIKRAIANKIVIDLFFLYLILCDACPELLHSQFSNLITTARTKTVTDRTHLQRLLNVVSQDDFLEIKKEEIY